MPTWPSTLPGPDADGYAENAPFPVVSAPVEGPQITRRRYTAAVTPVNARIMVDDTQLATFEDFYRDDLKLGSLTFEGPIRGVDANVATFRFIAGYRLERASDPYWYVYLSLVRYP